MSQQDREKWNARHVGHAGEALAPEPFLLEALAELSRRGLPSRRTALDVACGRGRHALALAHAGFEVLALDVSDVAVEALAGRSAREGLTIEARRWDLDASLPPGEWGLVVMMHFLDRRLFPALRRAVAPGGALVIETFTTAHAERTGFPRAFCLEPGELVREAGELEIVISRETESDGRPVASLVALQRAASSEP